VTLPPWVTVLSINDRAATEKAHGTNAAVDELTEKVQTLGGAVQSLTDRDLKIRMHIVTEGLPSTQQQMWQQDIAAAPAGGLMGVHGTAGMGGVWTPAQEAATGKAYHEQQDLTEAQEEYNREMIRARDILQGIVVPQREWYATESEYWRAMGQFAESEATRKVAEQLAEAQKAASKAETALSTMKDTIKGLLKDTQDYNSIAVQTLLREGQGTPTKPTEFLDRLAAIAQDTLNTMKQPYYAETATRAGIPLTADAHTAAVMAAEYLLKPRVPSDYDMPALIEAYKTQAQNQLTQQQLIDQVVSQVGPSLGDAATGLSGAASDLSNAASLISQAGGGGVGQSGLVAAPVPPEIDALIRAESERQGVDANLVRAVLYFESRFNPSAINPTSMATGLGQVMPSDVSDRYGGVFKNRHTSEELLEPATNIADSVAILKGALQQFPDDLKKALAVGYGGGYSNEQYANPVLDLYQQYQLMYPTPGAAAPAGANTLAILQQLLGSGVATAAPAAAAVQAPTVPAATVQAGLGGIDFEAWGRSGAETAGAAFGVAWSAINFKGLGNAAADALKSGISEGIKGMDAGLLKSMAGGLWPYLQPYIYPGGQP